MRQPEVALPRAQVREQPGRHDERPRRQRQHHDGEVHVLTLAHDDDVGGREERGHQGAGVAHHVVRAGRQRLHGVGGPRPGPRDRTQRRSLQAGPTRRQP